MVLKNAEFLYFLAFLRIANLITNAFNNMSSSPLNSMTYLMTCKRANYKMVRAS